ncbi:phospholipase/carboxylesterase, putative [Eimeria mitis]|uniref:Phospholipase/carboxylesterase, putative n=1 Tax=Eimeria mitis TaxID=44415 RepID=U6K1B2_9EIME|nr:phospholipase/carboxylesterase, putative [Eimeria mitis]CDJ29558.1 phospholipase/carboxylesterase, putative [Eimeria mitis]
MQRPPEMLLRNAQGKWEPEAAVAAAHAAAAADAYASQAQHLFALFCAPANQVRPYTPEERQTAILRNAAADLQAYVHPKVQVASFSREGRGLVAAEDLKRGEVLLRVPTSALLNVYTALTHRTFSPLAQLLLGLPPERLLQQEAAAQQQQQQEQQHHNPPKQQKKPEEPTEVQPLVDSDVVLCLFLLFLAFTNGEQGGRAVLRFLPAAGEADASATAAAVCASSAGDPAAAEAAGAAAAAAAQKEELLLMDTEGVVEFLGDAALASAVSRSEAKCKMMQEQLLPLLLQTFPPPEGMQQGGGVISACRAAAAAAATTTPPHVLLETCTPTTGAVAAAAAAAAATAQAGAACGAPAVSASSEGTHLLRAFLAQLNYADFLWAHLVLESRSFSLPLGPLGPLQEFQPAGVPLTNPPGYRSKAASVAPTEEPSGGPSRVHKGEESEGDNEQEEEEEAEERRVPFLLELVETGAAEGCRCVMLPVGFSGGPQGVEGPPGCAAAPAHFVRLPLRCASFVPLGDLLNHDFHAQVLSPVIEEEGKSLCLRLACDVPAGAQVYVHYGPLQSWQFLAFFGFCPSSFPRLQPPQREAQRETIADKTDRDEEWQFTAETNAAAGETPWGPTYTFTAIKHDPEAAARIREILMDALQSVAKAAEDRTAQLDQWSEDSKPAPRWVRVWGERLRVYLNNQRALADTQMKVLNNYLSSPLSSSMLPSLGSAAN